MSRVLMRPPILGSHVHLCQPAWLKHGRHHYEIAACVDEARQRLIVEEGKLSILAPQRSSQGCELCLHTSQSQASDEDTNKTDPWRDSHCSNLT